MEKKTSMLQAGSDAGNTRQKTSYIDETGNVVSISFPTLMAPGNSVGDPLRKESKDLSITDRLHVYIQSKALSGTYYYVGDYARDKKGMVQPDGAFKSSSELHIVTQLTALAIIAASMNKERIDHFYSGGLPIEEFKIVGESTFLERISGEHVIEFLDGIYNGKVITINITGGIVNIEGATTSLALTNNIIENKLIELPSAKIFDDEDYCIGDLGAGTTDVALFEGDGLNGINSTNYDLGTNKYIDEMINEINEIDEFKEARDFLKENNMDVTSPYTNREQFLRQVVFPEIATMLADKTNKYQPTFKVSWASKRNVIVTEIVLKHMKSYYDEVVKQLNLFALTKAPNVNNFFLVGGGLLFAYYYFRNIEFFKLPDLEVRPEAQYFTSRAYLISSYIQNLVASL
ncbi:ParM/StbA family protein [Paenibacillus glucanolyticus]|jgi:plasmid segregation protein ParM|uniref:Actin-like protein N-terminal domain-containing protein n=1 Tax=Paenibacillus glucanolyticus TaxID=59843 RepID=A0A163GN46_9BACL|nr:ParM/StbA family protein [Paenibacillus glucanolyticus]KZS45055.1 hypothetical protein AWU65_03475 [Paenibacillus glucanolyticus]OMF63875.1 hypothetical protein BK142_32415 [Paenibacillus glucanolyticus]